MSVNTNLLSLPEEVVCYISKFLNLPDLLALSATCQRLRSNLNRNEVWCKYSQEGSLSKVLKDLTSVVTPIFDPEHVDSTLEPLCEHRIHCWRQSHLFNNYYKGKFVTKCLRPVKKFLSNFETYSLRGKGIRDRQITYKDQYLFALDYNTLSNEMKVYDIKEVPRLLVSFELINREYESWFIFKAWHQVVNNKLVICQDKWFDIYEIRLPDLEFSLLHSIEIKVSLAVDIGVVFIVRDFLIVGTNSYSGPNAVHMWNVCTGARLDDINPKIECLGYKICNHPTNQQDFIVSVVVSINIFTLVSPHLFVFSSRTLQYTDFHAVLPFTSALTFRLDYFGLVDSQYVVLLYKTEHCMVDVFVYDFKSSALLVKEVMEIFDKSDSIIFNGYLAVHKASAVEILSLQNLETVWKIEFEDPKKALERVSFNGKETFKMLTFHNLIVVTTHVSTQVWNLETRQKCFSLPMSMYDLFITVTDSYSKLVFIKNSKLKTLTFW